MKSNLELRGVVFDTKDVMAAFHKRMVALAHGVKGKTEIGADERFACCVVAGVKTKTILSPDGMTLKFETVEPAAVIWVDGQWQVVVDRRSSR